MVAIQLNIWDAVPTGMAPEASRTKSSTQDRKPEDFNVCPRGENETTMSLNPCIGCPLKEWCSDDDCGMKLYDIDDAEQNYYDFEEWLTDPI